MKLAADQIRGVTYVATRRYCTMKYLQGKIIDKPDKINILAIFLPFKIIFQKQKFACRDKLHNYSSEVPQSMLITNLSCQAFCHVAVNPCIWYIIKTTVCSNKDRTIR